MKRFLLGALGTLGLAGHLLAQEPAQPMTNADGSAPVMLNYTPTQSSKAVAVDDGHGYDHVGDQCDGGRGLALIGGADLLYLRPHFNNNQAQSIVTINPPITTTTDGIPTTIRDTTIRFKDFDYSYSVSPRLWIGAESECGLGIRGRWFHYDQSANPVVTRASDVAGQPTVTASSEAIVGNIDVDARNDGRILATSTNLFLDVWDLEVTQKAHLCSFDILVAGGVRYAFEAQTYNVFDPNNGELVGDALRDTTILSRQTFTGAGPTLAVEATRSLGCGGLALYASSRGALLFGRGHEEGERTTIDTTPRTIDVANTRGDSKRFDMLSMLELELGVEWSRHMGNANVFLRPAFVGQLYINGGNDRHITDDFGRISSSDFGLMGVVVTAGVGF